MTTNPITREYEIDAGSVPSRNIVQIGGAFGFVGVRLLISLFIQIGAADGTRTHTSTFSG